MVRPAHSKGSLALGKSASAFHARRRILSHAYSAPRRQPDSTEFASGVLAASMPAGRPSPYKPDFARIAGRLCRNGATDIEVADILGISVLTFFRRCLLHAEYTDFV